VRGDLTVNLAAYRTSLINRETGMDEKEICGEKVRGYEFRALELGRNFHRWGGN